MSMARLSQELGKPDEARDLIAAAYGSFTQGFETLNLKDAKAMLEALQSPPG